MESKEKNLRKSTIILNGVILVLSLVVVLCYFFKNLVIVQHCISIGIILLEALCIFLTHKLEETTEQAIFNMSKNALLKRMKSNFKTFSLQSARDELRLGLNILLGVTVPIILVLTARLKNTFLFIELISLIVLAYMYADYIPHALYYAKQYDNIYVPSYELSRWDRGIASVLERGSKKDRYNLYEEYRKKRPKKFEIVRSRGIFVFCSSYISNGEKLDEVPLQYRMLFVHKLYANIPRYRITVLLSAIFCVMFLLEYNVSYYLIIIFVLVIWGLSIILEKTLLPQIGKIRLIKQCKILMKEDEVKTKKSMS